MRIVTWNCNASPRITFPETASQVHTAKSQLLTPLNADIATVQEIPDPSTSYTNQTYWDGTMLCCGVTVTTKADYTLYPLFERGTARSVYPFQVEGPQSFIFIAVCSVPQKQSPSVQDYVKEVQLGIETCMNVLPDLPLIIAGDFNSNAQWDSAGAAYSHTGLVDFLQRECGVVSAYHHYYGIAPGSEHHFTYYQYRHGDKPFHIDYCFVPQSSTIHQVEVGAFSDWSTHSDHCPLLVDVTL